MRIDSCPSTTGDSVLGFGYSFFGRCIVYRVLVRGKRIGRGKGLSYEWGQVGDLGCDARRRVGGLGKGERVRWMQGLIVYFLVTFCYVLKYVVFVLDMLQVLYSWLLPILFFTAPFS